MLSRDHVAGVDIMKKTVWILTAATAALGACASTPPPTEELALARAAVEQAQQPAARHAPDQLLSAQRKLAAAEAAARDEKYDQARRLAEEAEADARLAWAIAESSQARQSLTQVQESIATLKQELSRSNP
jgi:hypothetical protein